ncbi:hypothetical protein ACH4FX_37905 [Streptomyces sp. NPDC018019]|uniref:hypothetical protein n=1 Tax=Streptomyces sp. NPDC018019 TaxID=3365030 RepID=UPI00378A85FE
MNSPPDEATDRFSATRTSTIPEATVTTPQTRTTMDMGRAIRNKAQTAKGRIKETLGRTARNRQTQREGRSDRSMGNLKQAAAKARKAFKR